MTWLQRWLRFPASTSASCCSTWDCRKAARPAPPTNGAGGLGLLRWLRGRRDATPVIVLTARDAAGDRVAGLDSGADDYRFKPFDLDELSARMRRSARQHA